MGKKVIKSSLIYVLLGFLAPAVNFFLLPIYTKHLDKADYALITLAMLVQTVLTPLLSAGMIGAYSRHFYDHLDDKKALDRLFSTTLIFYVGIWLVFLGILSMTGTWIFNLFFTNDVFTFSRYGYYILVTALAVNIQLLILTYYRNQEDAGMFALWSVLFFISAAVSIYIGVAVLNMGADGSIKGRMWGTVLTIIPIFIFFLRNKGISFDWHQCKSMLPYALPLVPYLLLNVAFANFDKVLVERHFSLNVLGEYGFAVLIASVVEIIMNSVQSAVYPQVFRILARKEEGAGQEVEGTFRLTLLLNMLAIAALISFTGIALHWFIDPRYWDIMRYFPLLCLVYIPRLIFTVWGIPIMYFKKTKYLPFANGLSLLLGITLGTTLIRPLGIFALPIALFCVQVSQCFLAYLLNRHLNIQLPAFRNLKTEYFFLFVLFFTGAVATYLYNTRCPHVYIYLPVFLISFLLLILFNFRKFSAMKLSIVAKS